MDLWKDLHYFKGAKCLSFYIPCDTHHLYGLVLLQKIIFQLKRSNY